MQIFLISFEESFRLFADPFEVTSRPASLRGSITKSGLHQLLPGTHHAGFHLYVRDLQPGNILNFSTPPALFRTPDICGFATVANGLAPLQNSSCCRIARSGNENVEAFCNDK
jgi:hypothetical protein